MKLVALDYIKSLETCDLGVNAACLKSFTSGPGTVGFMLFRSFLYFLCVFPSIPASLLHSPPAKGRNSNSLLELTWLKPIFTDTLTRANLSLCPPPPHSLLLFVPFLHILSCYVPAILLPFTNKADMGNMGKDNR